LNHEIARINDVFSFHSKMAMQTPIFLPDDFNDKRAMIRNRRPLSICIAFVTARFVPGVSTNKYILDLMSQGIGLQMKHKAQIKI
jgi:hypothetical protein